MAKRVAIYSRVSTSDQKTLRLQEKTCKEYIESRGWELSFKFKEVGSGVKLRPRREELLKLARQRQIDVIVVWKLDRWGRSVPDVVSTLQELEAVGVSFVSITESLDFTTPIGRAMSGLLAVFAEFERNLLSERVKAGLEQAKSRGQKLGRPTIDEETKNLVVELWNKYGNVSKVSRELGISRRSVSRICKRSIN